MKDNTITNNNLEIRKISKHISRNQMLNDSIISSRYVEYHSTIYHVDLKFEWKGSPHRKGSRYKLVELKACESHKEFSCKLDELSFRYTFKLMSQIEQMLDEYNKKMSLLQNKKFHKK